MKTFINKIYLTPALFLLMLICGNLSYAAVPTEASRAVSLVDYIAGDYQMAVSSKGGKIINQMEYSEMKEFISLISHYLDTLQIAKDQPIRKDLALLNKAIEKRKSVSEVRQLAFKLKEKFVEHFKISTAPKTLPDLEIGKEIYLQSCSTCHGMTGRADTVTAKQLNPAPASFHDADSLKNLSPFKAFNTTTFGIADTAMPSFSILSEQDRWAVASYLFLLRADLPRPTKKTPLMSWEKSMSLSDGEILKKLKDQGVSENEAFPQLSQIRNLIYENKISSLAPGRENRSALGGINTAKKNIKSSLASLEKNDFKTALNLSVGAYLDGFELSETVLAASGNRELVRKIEQKFMDYRQALKKQENTANTQGKALLVLLDKAEVKLKENKVLSPGVAFLASFTIVFREGLEAILLLAIILSALTAIKGQRLKKWVHGSWIGALIVGFLTWVVARNIISGSAREGIEGWVSLLAAAVLLYVSFWLFAKQDAEKWKSFLIGKIKGKKKLGIATIVTVSFLAVYREAFETVLFFEALKLQTAQQTFVLSMGALVGFGTLIVAAWLILKAGKKLPLHIFFGVSSVLLYLVAVVFVGQGIHALQEANLISQTHIPFFTIPALGVFPYLEGISFQGVLIFLFVFALFYQQWIKRPQTEAKLEQRMTTASAELFDVHELGEHLKEHLKQLKSKIGKQIAPAEMKEIIGHMTDLDNGIHHAILQLEKLHSEIPRRYDEVFQEVEELQDRHEHQDLIDRAQAFKNHLQSLKKQKK